MCSRKIENDEAMRLRKTYKTGTMFEKEKTSKSRVFLRFFCRAMRVFEPCFFRATRATLLLFPFLFPLLFAVVVMTAAYETPNTEIGKWLHGPHSKVMAVGFLVMGFWQTFRKTTRRKAEK